jgi:phage protein D
MIISKSVGNVKGVSAPRSIVRLDGHSVNFIKWTVNLNSTHEADDFTITLPFKMTTNLAQGYLSATPDKASYLFTNSNVLVEVFVGFPKNPDKFQTSDLTRIMYGYMDTAELDFSDQGETVVLTGRNMMAPFIDTKSTVKYQNMTSSAIAQMLAKNHGLSSKVTPTYTLAGKYFQGDSTAINKDTTEWDLLAFLAEQEGFDIRVFDNTLYFGPFETIVGNVTKDGLNYAWGQNIRELTLSRSPHAAKDIVVEVHSFDTVKTKHVKGSAKKKTVTYTTSTKNVTATAKNSTGTAGSTTTYTQCYFFPGLTQDQAQKKATAILNQLSKLEVTGTMSVAGNEKLTIDRLLVISGLGTGLSSNYYVRKASHNFDITSDGYRVDLDFSNLLLIDEFTGGL